MAQERNILIPCECGKIHQIPDPGRNAKFKCTKTGSQLVYNCRTGENYRLRGKEKDIPLETESLKIGRTVSDGILLNRPGISRSHSILRLTGDGYEIEDLGSSNGTFVNETRLEKGKPVLLVPGDLVRLADTIFRYMGPEEEESASEAKPVPSVAVTDETQELDAGEEEEIEDELVGSLLGEYEIMFVMSQGGMGRLYRARHKPTGRDCVIKTILPEIMDSETTVERFLREIDVGAKITHPNVIEFLGTGQTKRCIYMAIEYFEGKNLREWFRKRKAQIKASVLIGRQTAAALSAAHALGIVHRDIKPGNIVMNKKGTVKLLDFGIAKVCNDPEYASLTMSGVMVGTPQYMAPEQLQDSRGVENLADIYSLGAIIYFCLTGRPPHPGKNLVEVIKSMRSGKIAPITNFRDDVPKTLEAILKKAMNKKPEKRFQSAKEFHDALMKVKI